MSTDDDSSAGEDDLEIREETDAIQIIETPNENEDINNVQDQEAEDGDPAEDANKKESKVKRVRNPQPKLNAERLSGPRGLVALEDMFTKVKFKGPKHEEEDLNRLMKTYEYWCHRLFPRFSFDNCLERLEKLGTTKLVQNYVKRVRLNMVEEPPPLAESSDSDDDHLQEEDDVITPNIDLNPRDDFDLLLPPVIPQPTPISNTDSGELSQEQLDRICLNRERAQQRRGDMLIHDSQDQCTVDINNFSESLSQESISSSQTDHHQSTNGQVDVNNSELSQFHVEINSADSSNDVFEGQVFESQASQIELTEKSMSVRLNKTPQEGSELLDNRGTNCTKQNDSEMMSASSQESQIHTSYLTSAKDIKGDSVQESQSDLNMSISQSEDQSTESNTIVCINEVDCGSTMMSQGSEMQLTCMSVDSENHGFGRSQEAMIVSEVDSPMDIDST